MPAQAPHIIKRRDAAKSERVNFETLWQEVANLVVPSREFTIRSLVQGRRRGHRIYNDTAPQAHDSLSSATHGLMTPPYQRWFSFEDADGDSTDEEAAWFYDTAGRIHAWLDNPLSGWGTASIESFQDDVAFGTSHLQPIVDGSSWRIVARRLNEHYMMQDDEGNITERYRDFEMDPADAAEKFGEEQLHEKAQKELAKQREGKDFARLRIIHGIMKRSYFNPNRRDAMNKPWASVYVDEDNKHVISESGFSDDPYITSRWDKASGETYGRGPAIKALASIKTVNAKEFQMLMAGDLANRPPMNVEAGATEGPVLTAPGAINYYKAGTQPPAPMNMGINAAEGRAEIARIEARIEQFFYMDAIRLPQIDRMTREEVVTRRQQGLLLASPVLSRVEKEKLQPVIISVYRWMLRTNQLLPAPASLQRKRARITYHSPMHSARRASEADAIVDGITAASNVVGVDPRVVSNLDADAAFRRIMLLKGADPKLLKPTRVVEQERQAQAELEQSDQQLLQAQAGATALRDAGAGLRDLSETAGAA